MAAIMFTDMVGYTALGQRNESLSLALVEEQRRLIRPILARHGGREVRTIGDAFLVIFPNALDAVRCAYDIQRAVREFNIPLSEDRRVHLRIGVHLGDVVESGADISGDAVNVASRIEPLAEDGGICITRAVYDQIENKFELQLTSLGLKELKSVLRPLEVYRVVLPWETATGASSAVQLDRRRIAVLPLSNISHDQSDEYFADGMTEELINALSHVQGLKVIARTSVARYKTSPKPVSEIAKELVVGTVLEGSVRKAGDRVRVTAQLIDATTEENLWSENYDRKVEDIFAIQSDIAGIVAESLKTKLLEDDRERIVAGYTSSPQAYDKYLLARYGKGRDPFEKIRYYEEALKLDPNFALAHAGLANFYVVISGDFMTPKEAFSKAREHVSTALRLNDRLADSWVAKANLEIQYEWNLHMAENSLKRAIELNPNVSGAYSWHAAVCLLKRKYEEAVQLALKERSLNPYPVSPTVIQALSLSMAKRREDVIRECARLKELYPSDPDAHNFCVLAYGLVGMTREAATEMDLLRAEMMALRGQGVREWTAGVASGFYSLNAFNYAALGRTEIIRSILREAEEEASKGEHVGSSALGTLHLALGDMQGATELFEKSVEERDPGLFLYSIIYARLISKIPGLVESVKSFPRLASLFERFGILTES